MNVNNAPKTADALFRQYADVVTVPELAKMLRIGRNSAYTLIGSGQIQCVRVGNQIRIPKSSVIEFMSQHCKKECYMVAI